MESGQAAAPGTAAGRLPGWLAGLLPLLVLGAAIGLFVGLGAPGLERNGVPAEELSVESTKLRPGQIEVTLRNDGPDPVAVRQVTVNDGFAAFRQSDDEIGRLGSGKVTVDYPWIEGQAYEVGLITATGGTVTASVEGAAETPDADLGFFG
ncbi:MAG TPA: hypothetical protein VGV10_03380, partial [Thermoleophilaceae bacterium]|nr:hypothetical protein [Thermoleophilaceae bacterium]